MRVLEIIEVQWIDILSTIQGDLSLPEQFHFHSPLPWLPCFQSQDPFYQVKQSLTSAHYHGNGGK